MNLTPKKIVAELDRYIIGQNSAKRAVAVALRNRYRRSKLTEEQREEITPKNIIMKGPTGVGKTEIARRLAKLVKAPFVKVEATKFTEVGYVGRDVESMIRDLAEVSVRLVKEEKIKEVKDKALKTVEMILVKPLSMQIPKKEGMSDEAHLGTVIEDYRAGKLDDFIVELELTETHKTMNVMPGSGIELNIGDIFGGMIPKNKKKRKIKVSDAKKILFDQESEKLIDNDSVNVEAIRRAEQEGIIFIDEIDKIAAKGNQGGPDVSREGVQRDILPIVEGCSVTTKYGAIRTDFILFIAAGAFHISNISDLIPELQGRFPICVTLESLSEKDFINILTKPDNSITSQYAQLLAVDNIRLIFKDDAIEEIAKIAASENENKENIGARRLHTVMELLLEDISFNATGEHPMTTVEIDRTYVQKAYKDKSKRATEKIKMGFRAS